MLEEIVRKQFPFFEAGLRDAITEKGTYREFEVDEELIREDQYIRSFPIMLSGLILVWREAVAHRRVMRAATQPKRY